MAEFFVLRGWRGRGVGTKAAHDVWKRFPGVWEVRVMQANISAQHFWAGAIEALAQGGRCSRFQAREWWCFLVTTCSFVDRNLN